MKWNWLVHDWIPQYCPGWSSKNSSWGRHGLYPLLHSQFPLPHSAPWIHNLCSTACSICQKLQHSLGSGTPTHWTEIKQTNMETPQCWKSLLIQIRAIIKSSNLYVRLLWGVADAELWGAYVHSETSLAPTRSLSTCKIKPWKKHSVGAGRLGCSVCLVAGHVWFPQHFLQIANGPIAPQSLVTSWLRPAQQEACGMNIILSFPSLASFFDSISVSYGPTELTNAPAS